MPSGDPAPWLADLARELPQAQVRVWQTGDDAPADYALVWKPPPELLRGRAGLKAVFNLGAGVDAILQLLRDEPGLLAPQVPVIKLDDAGMGVQMVEYVTHAVVRRFRRFDEYEDLQRRHAWHALAIPDRTSYRIGVMGLGALGARVATALAQYGFPVRGWSNSRKTLDGVSAFAGDAELPGFLDRLNVLVDMLPLTRETTGILNSANLARLARGAHLINVARGAHVIEADLLEALDAGQVGWATLDVFRDEPLPADHPFWNSPRITLTPHVSALTEREPSVRQIADRIRSIERGEQVAGVIDVKRGY